MTALHSINLGSQWEIKNQATEYFDAQVTAWQCAVESTDLAKVLDQEVAQLARLKDRLFVSRIFTEDLAVRMPASSLQRILNLVMQGWASLYDEDGQDVIELDLLISKCLSGYGAMLELHDERLHLPHELVCKLTRQSSLPPKELRGWQLCLARDLIKRYGGRLCVDASGNGDHQGATLRLYLPLAQEQVSVMSTERIEELCEVTQ